VNDVLSRSIEAIDAANAADPNLLLVDGRSRPKELVHAERMSYWLERLDPDASETQRVAARAHHFRRWAVSRDEYESGRAGYLRWRRDQSSRQCGEISELLVEVGMADRDIEQVVDIMSKKGLGSDHVVQTHEDALCLVFVELQLDDLIERLDPEAAKRTLRKTLEKMSGTARALALEVASPQGRSSIEAVLAQS
jgi:hypothetical protein